MKNRISYKKNFISFLREDLINLILSVFFTLSVMLIINLEFIFSLDAFLVFVILISLLGFLKLFFNHLYQLLVNKNIIQKNIMLVGSYKEIKEIFKNKFDKILIFKWDLIR